MRVRCYHSIQHDDNCIPVVQPHGGLTGVDTIERQAGENRKINLKNKFLRLATFNEEPWKNNFPGSFFFWPTRRTVRELDSSQ